jgi:tetratricopeptide (TPR) repeat protein
VSLNNFSLCLSDLGRREEALQAIQEAVELRRHLAADCPAAFNPNLAASPNNFSHCLSDLDRQEETLQAIQEAVEFYRRLAADHPAAFNTNLTVSQESL